MNNKKQKLLRQEIRPDKTCVLSTKAFEALLRHNYLQAQQKYMSPIYTDLLQESLENVLHNKRKDFGLNQKGYLKTTNHGGLKTSG